MARRVSAALLLGLSLAACSWTLRGASTATATPTPGAPAAAFAALSNVPLKLPHLGPGQSCPVSVPRQLGPGLGKGLGSSAVYVFSAETVHSDLAHSNKVAWGADPSYSGPIRIRGGRLDGAGQLLLENFDNTHRGAPVKTLDGGNLMQELDLLASHSTFPNVPSGWRMWPSGTYVPTPRCYAWQVDGLGFTELIIFH